LTARRPPRGCGLGVQYGVGPHLAHPLVVDPELAQPCDEVIPVAWFQRREVRVFRERGDTLKVPMEMTPLSTTGVAVLDDRSFARFLVETARTLQAEHDPERILQIAAAHRCGGHSCDLRSGLGAHRFRRVFAGAGQD
jgi:hypothetical protein